MPPTSEYKIVMGNGQLISAELRNLPNDWRPILMSAVVGGASPTQVQVVVIFEHVLGT